GHAGNNEAIHKHKLWQRNYVSGRLLTFRSPSAEGSGRPQSQQPNMVKSFATLAVVALLGAAVVALPGLAPAVQANEAAALAKGDRLALRARRYCTTHVS